MDPILEIKTAVEDLTETTRSTLAAGAKETKSLADRLDRIEISLNRIPAAARSRGSGEESLEAKAFGSFLRQGREALPLDEVKSLRVADDTAGGYLAPTEFVREVLKVVREFSPVRQVARVGMTGAGSVILPKRTSTPTARWVGETEDRKETGSTYGQVQVQVNEAACFVDVSNALLEDAAIDVNGEIVRDLAEEFARIESTAFVIGDGVGKPQGFLNTPVVQEVANGHTTTLQADALIGLVYSLPALYRNRGAFLMNGGTLAAVRKLKDSQGQYLWQPSLQAGQPETLLGRPVVEAIDMPDPAAGSTPIAFGDFESGYRIYDRVSLSVLRDPYSVATKGLTRFHARRRVGGGVVLGEALRKLKMTT